MSSDAKQEQANAEAAEAAEAATAVVTPPAPPTDEEKLATATSKRDELQASIATKAAAGEDFTAEAIAYAAAIATHKGLFKIANQGAIDEETAAIANTLTTLIGASKLEELMGEPVSSVFYQVTPGEGENGPVISCGINVRARATSTKAAGKTTTSSSGSAAKETYSVNGGEQMSPKDFIEAAVTPEDAEKSLFKTGKWKTQPDFLAHAVAALEASGQMVTITPVTE
ncbi:MAG: hypothetical protein KAJ19_28210 [Gammaproteobacteria bacterium]|nr:hypothetical protein [Gammaproteobacteria bacterium]